MIEGVFRQAIRLQRRADWKLDAKSFAELRNAA